ncbi:MAG: hypothetical protein ACTSU5_19230 [Promethearchaeota archaeon]
MTADPSTPEEIDASGLFQIFRAAVLLVHAVLFFPAFVEPAGIQAGPSKRGPSNANTTRGIVRSSRIPRVPRVPGGRKTSTLGYA